MADYAQLQATTLKPLEAAGIDLPDEAARVLALWEASGDIVNHDPAAELATKIADGTLTVDNIADALRQAALDVQTRQGALTIRQQLQNRFAALARQAINADTDRIIGKLAPRFDKAAAVIADNVGKLNPRDDAATILADPDKAKAHHAVTQAAAELETIRYARLGLPHGASKVPVAMFLDTVRDNAHLRNAGTCYRDNDRPGGRWGALHADGYTLRLNTPDETAALVADAQAETEQQRANAHKTPPRPPHLMPAR